MASSAKDRRLVHPVEPGVRAQVVLYRNPLADVWRMFRGLCAAARVARRDASLRWIEVFLGDCSPTPVLSRSDVDQIRRHALAEGIDEVSYECFGANLKSALGHNTLATGASTDFLLILNPDTYPSPGMLAEQLAVMGDPRVGIAEARQIPMEHPKAFDLRSGDTSWASTCSVLVRRAEAFAAVGGFDADHFPLYCDDVDFSWRVRLAGLRVVHVPAAVVFHAKQIGSGGHIATSALEVYEGTLARLLLGVKYDRPDIVDQTVTWIERHGNEDQADALAQFRRRASEGALPAVVDGAARAAQFVNGEYAVHRF
jgi:hypothetical protein